MKVITIMNMKGGLLQKSEKTLNSPSSFLALTILNNCKKTKIWNMKV